MPCNVYTQCPGERMTLRKAKALIGSSSEFPAERRRPKEISIAQWERKEADARREWEAKHDAPLSPAGQTFLCGDIEVAVCACGHSADFLCDYPIGRGKTCDLALCYCCRESVGEERDFCRVHAAQFRGAERVVPKFSGRKLVKP
jgi:hypothetical protein